MPNEGNDETRVKLEDVLRLEKKHVHRKLEQRGPIESIQDGPGGRGEPAGKASEWILSAETPAVSISIAIKSKAETLSGQISAKVPG
jgi:hypothetical protein